jgi:hypothetical protein
MQQMQQVKTSVQLAVGIGQGGNVKCGVWDTGNLEIQFGILLHISHYTLHISVTQAPSPDPQVRPYAPRPNSA